MACGDRVKTTIYDNVGTPDPIIVQSYCREVLFYENGGANTTSFNIYEPKITSGPVLKTVTSVYPFKNGPYSPGDIIGYCETVDVATATFAQEEK